MSDKIIIYVLRLLAKLPLGLAQQLGGVLGRLSYLFASEQKRIARINIALCLPELDQQERNRLLRESMIENALTLVEMPSMWSGDPSRWIEKIELADGSQEVLEEALSLNKGLIVAGPHLGNWELGPHYLSTFIKTTALYKPPKVHAVEEMMTLGRSSSGSELVPTTTKGVRALYSALARSEAILVFCDQEPSMGGKQGGIYAPFFGNRASTMVLVNRLAKKSAAPVLFWFAERLPNGRGFRMHWLPAPEGIVDEDSAVSATALNRGLEQCVRIQPAQYLWSYKRFRTQPDQTPNIYSRPDC
ncbi:MAG: lysophospholipid acyltransferase family protein [Candidatus Sedimenticola sp. 4PFRAG1]